MMKWLCSMIAILFCRYSVDCVEMCSVCLFCLEHYVVYVLRDWGILKIMNDERQYIHIHIHIIIDPLSKGLVSSMLRSLIFNIISLIFNVQSLLHMPGILSGNNLL